MAKKSFFEKLGLVEGVAASASDKPATNVTTNASTGDDTINLSLDEWAG